MMTERTACAMIRLRLAMMLVVIQSVASFGASSSASTSHCEPITGASASEVAFAIVGCRAMAR
jgi:hypothetical protein